MSLAAGQFGEEEAKKLRHILHDVDFLFHLKVRELDPLLEAMKKKTYAAGATVIKQGDPGDAFYIIASGSLSVWIKKGIQTLKVATLGQDKFFGEMALVENQPRSATIKADQASELYVLSKVSFRGILMGNPGIAQNIKMVIAKRKAANAN